MTPPGVAAQAGSADAADGDDAAESGDAGAVEGTGASARGRSGWSGSRSWLRPAALLAIALSLGIFHTLVLILIPLALLLASAQPRRPLHLLVAAVLVAAALAGAPASGLWYVERGWAFLLAGCFTGLTLLWPGRPFTPRALGAVAGGMAAAALLYLGWPEGWTITDWMVGGRLREGAAVALEAMQLLGADGALSPALVATVHQTVEFQGEVFPALVALSSVASLGVGWWLFHRLAHGREGAGGLGPLRDFRFNDQLVWILIAGIALLIWGGAGDFQRLGTNLVVFMAMLYAVRGAAVALSVAGGISLVGSVLLGVGLLLAAPLVFAGALALGVGDTWLDIRARMAAG